MSRGQQAGGLPGGRGGLVRISAANIGGGGGGVGISVVKSGGSGGSQGVLELLA